MSNNRNPVAIVVPCHRVIASSGSLCGYGGGLDIKRKLLDMEQANQANVRPCLPLGIGA
jgi:methylated-DNA-[protein]-cysteine S-methyltransferase